MFQWIKAPTPTMHCQICLQLVHVLVILSTQAHVQNIWSKIQRWVIFFPRFFKPSVKLIALKALNACDEHCSFIFFTSYTAQCRRIYTLRHSRIFPSYTSPPDGTSWEQNSKLNNVSHYNPLNQAIILFKCFTVMCFATQRKATTTKSPAGTSMNLVRLFPLFHTLWE